MHRTAVGMTLALVLRRCVRSLVRWMPLILVAEEVMIYSGIQN